ncbi:protein jagged-1-like [Haliotis rubra]|uniref:protein jagged-1-like n=1 Tax=Haliotis rubra TaxID=36100 RepID=UPI001EE60446|nr:protein jagged-1-like [Haliotis rubra]
MFTLCIGIAGPGGRQPCSVYKRTTKYVDNHNTIPFGSSIQGTANPFIIPVDNAVPSSIKITVEVYDKDHTSSDDHMDTLSKLINIRVAATEQTAMYNSYTLSSRTTLKIAVRAYCDPEWYGSACVRNIAKATPDHSHYTCHPHTGAKMCFEGWKGDNCNKDIDECTESDQMCQHGGTCTNTNGSFECACAEGIKGKLCENIINQCALEPCLNGGTCDGNELDFKCACLVEWTGDTCADKVNFCDSSPCNMGQCTPDLLTATRFKCDCDFPWVGGRCNQRVDIFNITLLGEIDHTSRGDLADGFNRLITELGGIPGKVTIKFTTKAQRENNYTSTHVQLYSAVENGSFLENDSLARIFESNPDEIINEYLPLPLYPPRKEEKATLGSPHDDVDTNQYVLAILPPVGLVLMSVLLLVASCIWRRSNKTEQCRDDIQLDSFAMDVACNPQPSGAMTGNLQGASVSPDGYTSLRFLGSPDTQCDEASNALPTTETGAFESVRPSGYPDGHTRLGDFGTLDTRRHVTSYIQPVPEDMTLDRGSLEEEEDNAEYTVIDDNEVEDILQEDPYETIESVDDKDDENISQEKTL